MTLDDRATYGEPHPHPVSLRGIERAEQLVRGFRPETASRLPHTETHGIARIRFGPDEQLPWPIVHAAHRVGRVAEQVQHHLLELDPIAHDRWEVFREFSPDHDAVSLQLAEKEGKHFAGRLVQIDGLEL